ncbi:MAG: Transcriptional regulator, HxlR family, partial [uncultured Rubrobacteraceae bacterium]
DAPAARPLRPGLPDAPGPRPHRRQVGGPDRRGVGAARQALWRAAPRGRGHLAEDAYPDASRPRARRAGAATREAELAGDRRVRADASGARPGAGARRADRLGGPGDARDRGGTLPLRKPRLRGL